MPILPKSMNKSKSFKSQLLIISGFIAFFYIFFALTTSIYKDYKLEKHIQEFESRIQKLAGLANQKPKDVEYFSSHQYKDRYAKENLNLLNPGEKLIVIPREEQNVVKGQLKLPGERKTPEATLSLPIRNQWWEYFFGETLSVKAPETTRSPSDNDFEDRVNPEQG
jgi:cell division protein FtsB